MVAEGPNEPKKITRRVNARPNGCSVVRVGDVEVEIYQVSNRGHKGFKVVMPEGGKIENRKEKGE